MWRDMKGTTCSQRHDREVSAIVKDISTGLGTVSGQRYVTARLSVRHHTRSRRDVGAHIVYVCVAVGTASDAEATTLSVRT